MPHLVELDLNLEWTAVSAGALSEVLPALTALVGLSLSPGGGALCAPAIATVSRCSQLRSLELVSHVAINEWASAFAAALSACPQLARLRLCNITPAAG